MHVPEIGIAELRTKEKQPQGQHHQIGGTRNSQDVRVEELEPEVLISTYSDSCIFEQLMVSLLWQLW